MPALLTCPAASDFDAPGGPEIDVGEVIRKNLERTRSQVRRARVQCEIILKKHMINSVNHACTQDLATAEMVVSSASEMDPVKDSNQCCLNLELLGFLLLVSYLNVRMSRRCIWGLRLHLETRHMGSSAHSSPVRQW